MASCGIHRETTFANWHKSPFMILILPGLHLLPSTSSLPFPDLDTSELCLQNMPTPSISSPPGLKGTTQALREDSADLPDCIRCLSLSSNISLCPKIHQNWLGAGLELLAQGLEHRKQLLCVNERVSKRMSK